MKFIRRAVEDDKNLAGRRRCSGPRTTSTCGSTSTRRRSWPAGFPKTRDELFAYRGHHPRQHRGGRVHRRSAADDRRVRRAARRRPADARRRRGRSAKAATPARRSPTRCRWSSSAWRGRSTICRSRGSRSDPTRAGEAHAVTQIAGTEAASSARWNELPVLTSVNPLRTLKPGATLLLTGTDEKRRTQPVLAFSATAAARRSRCRFRTRGCGRCTRHAARGHDARELLAAAAALARGRRARSGRRAHQLRSGRGRRAGHADRRGRRQVVRRAERRAGGREGQGPAGQHRRRAAAVDRRAERRVPRHVHRRERRHVYGGRRSVARGQAARHRAPCTCARRPATPNTSTPPCTRRA